MTLKAILIKAASKDRNFRSALLEELSREARWTKGVPVPKAKLPEEFVEMIDNPPESVLQVREEMVGKSATYKGLRRFAGSTDLTWEDLPPALQRDLMECRKVMKAHNSLPKSIVGSPGHYVMVEFGSSWGTGIKRHQMAHLLLTKTLSEVVLGPKSLTIILNWPRE